MKKLFPTLILLFLCVANTVSLQAQCDPADNCAEATCIFTKGMLESGTWTNAGFTGSSPAGFCGTTETDMWFPVVADTSGNIQITLFSTNCQLGNGMQLALYSDCNPASTPIACNGGASGGQNIPLLLTATLTPGAVYFLLVDGYAGDMCDFTLQANGIGSPDNFGIITGQVLLDTDLDCIPDSGEVALPNIPVVLAGLNTYVRPTGADGMFSFFYADTGAVTVSLPGLSPDAWTACPETHVVNSPFFPDSTHVVFLLQPANVCTDLQVELGMPSFFRVCGTSNVNVNYCNQGSVTAEDAYVQIVLPPALSVLSASIPISSQSGDTLTFQLGNVWPFHCGSFYLWVKTDCDGDLGNQTVCVQAHIYPDSFCLPEPAWSGAHVVVSARCQGDTLVEFTLGNTGSAPMTSIQEYIIIEDEVVLRMGNFQLNPGETMVIDTAANGATWRVEAGQEENHPGFSMPSASLEGCGGLTPGLVTAYPQDDRDLFVDIECREIRTSFDPNLKVASPEGVGPDRLLKANTPIDYTIHFQNTGNDTAFLIRLVDALPPTLDPATFRFGNSSHPCGWQIRGGDTLEVLFNPIALPDSNVNEPASHGWFKFNIAQRPDLADGTVLENRAAIYFDYNDPVITDPARHTIGQLTVSIDPPAPAKPAAWRVLGNPAAEHCVFVAKNPSLSSHLRHFELYDSRGRLLRTESFHGSRFEFQRQELADGVYFFRITSEKERGASGRIVFHRP